MSPSMLSHSVSSWLVEHEAEVRETLRELSGQPARPDREQVEAALEAYTDCVEALDAFDPEPLIIRKQQRIEDARTALLALIFPEQP